MFLLFVYLSTILDLWCLSFCECQIKSVLHCSWQCPVQSFHPPPLCQSSSRQGHCVCACRSSAGVGAGNRGRVHTPWPYVMDHEGLLKAYDMVCYRK